MEYFCIGAVAHCADGLPPDACQCRKARFSVGLERSSLLRNFLKPIPSNNKFGSALTPKVPFRGNLPAILAFSRNWVGSLSLNPIFLCGNRRVATSSLHPVVHPIKKNPVDIWKFRDRPHNCRQLFDPSFEP